MGEIFIIHLDGDRKYVVDSQSDLAGAVEYIRYKNVGSVYLEKETEAGFLEKTDLDDGIYIILDETKDIAKVYKLTNLILPGYIYTSNYRMDKLLNQYELIESKKN